MGFKLIYASEVYDDLQKSIDWYNEKQTGLGSRFFKAVKEQLYRIKKILESAKSLLIDISNLIRANQNK